MNKVFLGTELKLNLNIDPINGFTMEDYDFLIDVYCQSSKVATITKMQAIKVDKNNYLICVNTENIGTGNLKCKVTAYVPDEDFPDSTRTEVSVIDTGITIIKAL